ncbi:MAG: FmdB family transcriptional regulator [Nocardioidaceae bacterium]|nr:FmdB family transcriptional regulator [Nocardioidaceae bacterium]
MPTYQYSCTECGHFFEAVQSFSEDSLTVCPECSGKLRKVFNAVGVVFKGSGFYRNDSRGSATSGSTSGSTPGSTPAAKESTSASSSASSSDSGSSTSTPAASSTGTAAAASA